MSVARWLLALATGAILAASPFLRYRGAHGEAHVDHEPHHGGQLGMAGDSVSPPP